MKDECDPAIGGHVIVAGFGVPGRAVADVLDARGVRFCVIELNPQTCERCQLRGVPIHAGDVTQPETLRNAGIEHASMFIIAIPDEKAALQATKQARLLNPSIRIITRTHYTSAGMTARTLGANDVIVAEQVVAGEAARLVEAALGVNESTSADSSTNVR